MCKLLNIFCTICGNIWIKLYILLRNSEAKYAFCLESKTESQFLSRKIDIILINMAIWITAQTDHTELSVLNGSQRKQS